MHEQTVVDLQRDPDPAVVRRQPVQHRRQRGKPGKIITDALLGQHPTRRVDDRNVVVLLGPVNPAVNLHRLHVLPER